MQNRKRLEFCSLIFMAEMRKRYAALHPEAADNPVGNLLDYPPEQRGALMASLEKAIDHADPSKDKLYDAWLANQTTDA